MFYSIDKGAKTIYSDIKKIFPHPSPETPITIVFRNPDGHLWLSIDEMISRDLSGNRMYSEFIIEKVDNIEFDEIFRIKEFKSNKYINYDKTNNVYYLDNIDNIKPTNFYFGAPDNNLYFTIQNNDNKQDSNIPKYLNYSNYGLIGTSDNTYEKYIVTRIEVPK
jgi:hypothetical protein